MATILLATATSAVFFFITRTIQFWPRASAILLFLLVFATLIVPLLSSLRRRIAEAGEVADAVLFALTMSAGLSVIAVAFVISTTYGGSAQAFFADAGLNLGAGFIGAAVTFVLFEVLLSGRNEGDGEAQELRREVQDLRRIVEDYIERDQQVGRNIERRIDGIARMVRRQRRAR